VIVRLNIQSKDRDIFVVDKEKQTIFITNQELVFWKKIQKSSTV